MALPLLEGSGQLESLEPLETAERSHWERWVRIHIARAIERSSLLRTGSPDTFPALGTGAPTLPFPHTHLFTRLRH